MPDSQPTPALQQRRTFCRICEPSCGLVAHVDADGRLARLTPDREHPVTQGFCCHKGLSFADVHHDPDRLNVPLRRVSGEGEAARFEAMAWPEAIDAVAQRLQDIRTRHGGDAIGGYFGNPSAFNALAVPAMSSLLRQLGSRRVFNSGTQDCSNKFAGSEAVYGTSTLHPIPDFANTRYALIFGENPRVSHMSFISVADPMQQLRRARQNGATIRFVNPRRIESASAAIGDVVQLRPDSDLYFMAALLHEIDAAGLFDEDVIARRGRNISGLREFIAPYSADAVAEVVGVPAAELRAMALDFARAESACVHMSTGVNMGRQGTLCYWLLQMLSFVTGNLDRPGGNLYGAGFYPAARAGRVAGEPEFFDSEFGPLRLIRGALPGNLLADMILSEQQPLRALVVLAGNPLLSVGGGERLRRAFEKLELLVVLDLFRTATGEVAHFLLPCADMLERPDVNICGLGMQSEPFVQYTEPVVAPAAERREEWWIFSEIERAMGFTPGGGEDHASAFARYDRMLSYSGLSLAAVREAPGQVAQLPPPPTGKFFSDYIQTEDQRVDCRPPFFDRAIARAGEIFAELGAEPAGQLKLINLRTPYMQNSWYQNVPRLKREGQRDNPLHICPDDAARLGLDDGQSVRVRSRWGAVETRVRIDDSLRPGAVAMTHGWGNARSGGLRVARQYPGVNVNALLPSGPGSFEALSNQAHMTGIPVDVEPL